MSDRIVERMEKRGELARMYLGDGLYVSVDHIGQIWLRAERELGIHEVALEPGVLDTFGRYVKRVHGLLGAGERLPERMR